MTKVERTCRAPVDRLLDLKDITQERRGLLWQGVMRENFPGLSISFGGDAPLLGSIERVTCGAGELIAVKSMPVEVQYQPRHLPSFVVRHISLMVQRAGVTQVSQGGRSCRVEEGDLCLLDEAHGFSLLSDVKGEIVFLRMPRETVLGRFPQLERQCAQPMEGSHAGAQILGDMLARIQADGPLLNDLQRAALMSAVIQLLGVAEPVGEEPDKHSWRVRRALDFIEMNRSVSGLGADDVARDQFISRRRLDQLMLQSVGQSIAAHLWARRLQQAATDLRDPAHAGQAVAQIAFANGFEDAGHFTRAFRKAYGLTPSAWRKTQGAGLTMSNLAAGRLS